MEILGSHPRSDNSSAWEWYPVICGLLSYLDIINLNVPLEQRFSSLLKFRITEDATGDPTLRLTISLGEERGKGTGLGFSRF